MVPSEASIPTTGKPKPVYRLSINDSSVISEYKDLEREIVVSLVVDLFFFVTALFYLE